jgi:hypothetical protein
MEPIYRVFILILMVVGFASMPAMGTVLTERLLADGSPDSGPRALWQGDHGLLAFYDAQGMLTILDPAVPDSLGTISPRGLPEVINSWIDLTRDTDRVYALWRPRPAKGQQSRGGRILFSASEDGGAHFSAPVPLSSATGASHPQPLVNGGEGWLYLVWPDDRLGPEGVYFNRSADHGRTWLQADRRIDRLAPSTEVDGEPAEMPEQTESAVGTWVYEPFLAADGATVWLGWGEAPLQSSSDQGAVKLRISKDGGDNWSAARELPTPDTKVFNMSLLRTHDGGLALFYFVGHGGIRVVRSEDDGETWGEIQLLGGTVAVGGQRFQVAQNRRGAVCLAWAGPEDLRGKKADVFATCSQDFARTWPAQPTRLDTDEPGLSHSLTTRMAMDDENNVVVAWRDSRHVRPNIYLNYTRDGGRRWQEQDIRLDREPGRYHSTYPWVASAGQGRFMVAWRTKTTDDLDNQFKLAYSAFTLPEVAARDGRFPALVPAKAQALTADEEQRRLARLRERIGEYWQALVDADYATAFSLMDPFYRARSNIFVFAGPLSKLNYLGYRLSDDGVHIKGVLATLHITVALEAPNLVVKGVKTPIPKREVEFPGKWVWIDGDWYRVYEQQDVNLLPL